MSWRYRLGMVTRPSRGWRCFVTGCTFRLTRRWFNNRFPRNRAYKLRQAYRRLDTKLTFLCFTFLYVREMICSTGRVQVFWFFSPRYNVFIDDIDWISARCVSLLLINILVFPISEKESFPGKVCFRRNRCNCYLLTDWLVNDYLNRLFQLLTWSQMKNSVVHWQLLILDDLCT